MPAFYQRPASIADMIDHLARRAIDLLGLAHAPLATPWHGPAG
jgi:4-hydroxy-3-polyprenylbenzoate decarboxylase